ARLRAVLENSAKNVEGGAKTARSEVVDLQRQAIVSLRECADIALRLAECLGDAACPRDITRLHLGDWNRCDACFNEQVSRFFDQASKFMTAIAASAEPGPHTSSLGTMPPAGPSIFYISARLSRWRFLACARAASLLETLAEFRS